MRKIFLTVIIIVSSLNLTGCGEGGPDMAQVGQAVTQIAGLVGQMQGAAGGGNNGGVHQAEAPAPMRAEAPQRMPAVAPAAAQMPAPNIRPQQNVQTPAMVPVQNAPATQVETKQIPREPQTDTIKNSSKPQVDEEPKQSVNTQKETDEDQAAESNNQTEPKDADAEDIPSLKNDVMQNIFRDEPLLATMLEDNSPTT